MKLAMVFPGQGSQSVGMLQAYAGLPGVDDVRQAAGEALGGEFVKLLDEGPGDALNLTRNTQPAIFLHSMVLASLLANLIEKHDVAMVAGHSLGEYSALVYAGAISFEDGLRLVRLRGESMQKAGESARGTMAAIVGLEPAVVEEVCKEAAAEGIVQCANFNSPGQIVISGSIPGVRKGMELAKARGAKLVKELVVSGAFHSPLMESARDQLRAGLASTTINDSRIPVYANVTARPVQKGSEIRTLLDQQLTSAVRWEESVRNMISGGATAFVEVGPGKVLQGLVKRIDPKVEVRGIEKFEELQSMVTA